MGQQRRELGSSSGWCWPSWRPSAITQPGASGLRRAPAVAADRADRCPVTAGRARLGAGDVSSCRRTRRARLATATAPRLPADNCPEHLQPRAGGQRRRRQRRRVRLRRPADDPAAHDPADDPRRPRRQPPTHARRRPRRARPRPPRRPSTATPPAHAAPGCQSPAPTRARSSCASPRRSSAARSARRPTGAARAPPSPSGVRRRAPTAAWWCSPASTPAPSARLARPAPGRYYVTVTSPEQPLCAPARSRAVRVKRRLRRTPGATKWFALVGQADLRLSAYDERT